MPTAKNRINVSVSDELNSALKKLAHRDQVPTATKAKWLLEVALEIEEDEVWNKIATERAQIKSKFLSHKHAWK